MNDGEGKKIMELKRSDVNVRMRKNKQCQIHFSEQSRDMISVDSIFYPLAEFY